MKSKEISGHLQAIQQYLMSDDEIIVVSVARSGVIKIVFNGDVMRGSDCVARMEEFGFGKFSWQLDVRSNSIFMIVEP